VTTDSNPSERRFSGIAVSPGIAIGPAHCLYDIPLPHVGDETRAEGKLLSELSAIENAVQLASDELQEIYDQARDQLGEKEAQIFRTHLSILHDQTLLQKVRRFVSDRGLTALAALNAVANEYEHLFALVQDDYIRQRADDLRDVLRLLGKHLQKAEPRLGENIQSPVILVAYELLPSDVMAINELDILGIVTQSGGRTSHAAILARSYGIPSVAGVAGILDEVANGDLLIVDGRGGDVFVHPSPTAQADYQQRRLDYAQLRDQLIRKSHTPSKTADQVPLELLANVSCVDDAREATREGAVGIGLYRTEFYFLTHPEMPSEDDQVAEYKRVIDVAPRGPFTIRTLDLGGDKTIPYLTAAHEPNPIMGRRSIRLSFQHPDFFLQQIRAVFRVAGTTNHAIRLMFPMVTTWEELQSIHQYVDRARDELSRRGEAFGEVAIGAMIEVPAAAIMIDQFVEDVDFISIGSNDLVQYINAADRDNPQVNHLCQGLSPAVIRVLANVIGSCRAAGKDVTVCGEMAGSPRALPLLLGMGLRSFSMSTAFIPTIGELARHISIADAEAILADTMKLKTPTEIQTRLDQFVRDVCPDAVLWLLK
jgi:phosphotransferase system enzyme I (PtsI)